MSKLSSESLLFVFLNSIWYCKRKSIKVFRYQEHVLICTIATIFIAVLGVVISEANVIIFFFQSKIEFNQAAYNIASRDKGWFDIRKTCPCNIYPLHHIYKVKLGYSGVYLFFLFLLQNIDCGYSLGPPLRGGASNLYPQSMF